MKKFFWRLFKIFIRLFVLSTVYGILCKWLMPPITVTQLSSFVTGDGLKRDYVSWDKISSNVKLAAIASEDQLFPDHNGFDWKALKKSLNSTSRKRIHGAAASTISQQTAKNVFLWQGEGVMKYVRKAPEFYYTMLCELVWGKKRILEVYLNTIEMGKGIYGIEAASQQYFHKSAKNLSRREAAMIIACLPNPKKFTVVPESKFVAWKTNWILKQMNNIQNDDDIRSIIK
ncbi:monofunctional biosynthetic peptidoglycan transglycosylase [Arachidicoccus ginsenosidimutans]|uniref:monofunctional biosynthetic peptidoglycan transglycosylase n=1 Tax=Arachidicoccus sp. BS20 TaxID=1850526 RepID=UPI0007F07505|nr:monofunctional biosynthetic peptidoglycan transglycosylase [Arachidicoccus sp. BS20]ANI88105.1 monofunctional biosynthetic peptidoglycan transglycosylase [Arachidicoccus sp. BS20]